MSIEPLQAPKPPSSPAAATDPDIDELLEDTRAPGTETIQPSSRRERRRDGRLRARQVTRIIRRVDPWSVLKVSAVLYLCLWLVVTVAGVILWQVARATGTLDNLQDFL